jgi:hypothetical protein
MIGARNTTRGTQQEWLLSLRTACITLSGASPGLIGALSVVYPLAAEPAHAGEIERLAVHMAAEYGLLATVEVTGSSVAVRIERAPDANPAFDIETAPARPDSRSRTSRLGAVWHSVSLRHRHTVSL